jgi:hypothetical protein
MAVSDRDRRHFERIGSAKAASHAEATERHRALTLEQRLHESWQLYLRHRDEVDVSKRDDDPSPFYERARRLGLYLG